MSEGVEPNFSIRAKMGQSSDVYAVAITADGKALFAKKEVKVTLGGCGGCPHIRTKRSHPATGFQMVDPMRIRAQAAGANATVRVLMGHEMETGLRKDSAGKTIPAWHITDVTATQWQDCPERRVGTRRIEEPVPAVHGQGGEGGRQDCGDLEGQQRGYANRRGGSVLNRFRFRTNPYA